MTMPKEEEAVLTPEFLKAHLKGIGDLDLSEQAQGMHELFTGLLSMMNTLQPEGYPETFPACTFRPTKE
jgi:hypothetical protein